VNASSRPLKSSEKWFTGDSRVETLAGAAAGVGVSIALIRFDGDAPVRVIAVLAAHYTPHLSVTPQSLTFITPAVTF